MLVNTFEINKLHVMNTSSRKWTWRSPDFRHKNEIDYILSDHSSMMQDVSVVNKINTGSYHRLVGSKILGRASQTTIETKTHKNIDAAKISHNREQYEKKVCEKLNTKTKTTTLLIKSTNLQRLSGKSPTNCFYRR